MTKSWTIVGKDLIKEVTCSEPYEWKDSTEQEWEFAPAGGLLQGCGLPARLPACLPA
jgi:hypothetical protein